MMNRFLKPATIAALLLFAGAVAPAMADDRVALDTGKVPSEDIQEISREQARRANEAAVEEAAEAVEADARLELDIRLIDRTSVLIAGDV